MRKTTASIALALIFSVPVQSQTADQPKIWNDLTAGMSKADVKAKYPKHTIPLTEQCFGDLSFDYAAGKLSQVEMEWSASDKAKNCGAVVAETLGAKYGEPSATKVQVDHPDCGYGKYGNLCRALGGETPTEWHFSAWQTPDGIDITFKTEAGDPTKWFATWARTTTPDAAAAGKL